MLSSLNCRYNTLLINNKQFARVNLNELVKCCFYSVYIFDSNSKVKLLSSYFNPLLPSAHKIARIAKILIVRLEGTIKKIPMSFATMSQ